MLPFNLGVGGASGAYTGDIPASLRFRAAASAYLSRAFSSAASTGTISTFVKRGALGTAQSIAGSRYSAGTNSRLEFTASDTITLILAGTTVCTTTAVYRDPTSWLHVVATFAPNGTAYIYVNGTQVASGATGASPWFFTNAANYVNAIGRLGDLAGNYFDGYQARFAFVDGTALTPSSFGYLNTEINEWVSKSASAVKSVVDAGGTNSFMLDFDDPNFATYNVGKDYSSKGNHWTPNNFSLTAGVSYDYMKSVPGNTYCIASEIDKGANPASTTLTEAGLKSVCAAVAGGSSVCGTMGIPEGKFYFELTPTAIGNGIILGITSRTSGAPSGSVVGYVFDGNKNIAGTGSAYGATYAANDVIGVAVDTTANTIEFFKNNASQGVITNSTYIVPGCKPLHWNNSSSGSSTVQHNYGQAPLHASATYHSAAGGYFRYAPPSGYKALCQRNMPDPAILNPEKHFDVVTYTGTAATKSITGLLFSPGLVEMKSRGRALDWAYYDSVRGVEKRLESNNADAEVTGDTTGLTAFNSDGWTMGALDQINGTTATNSFVGSAWKAGGAAVTNNAGSISSQVSANVDAGFSIVKHINTGAPGTIGHGLGKAPGLIINKVYDRTENWRVYFGVANKYLIMNNTAAEATDANIWNNTQPTSSVFSIGTYFSNGDDIISYCFAEIPGFSKIFSYTGNGSADGPFVHCGFKPKFILLKNASAAGNGWIIYDSERDRYNTWGTYLQPNTASAEGVVAYIDTVSNGFKVRTANADANGSTNTIIGIAFADVPGKYSLAR